MKILVCFKSDGLSQKLVSAARQYVDSHILNKINQVDFIWLNISKQRFEKFIEKEENQDISVVFLPVDTEEIYIAKKKTFIVETYGSDDYRKEETLYGLKNKYVLQERFMKYIYGNFAKTVIQLDLRNYSFKLIKREDISAKLLQDKNFVYFNTTEELKQRVSNDELNVKKTYENRVNSLKMQLQVAEKERERCLNNIYLIKNM